MCEWVFELGRSANLSFKGDREKPCRFWNAFFVRMLWLFRMFSVTVSRPLNSTLYVKIIGTTIMKYEIFT